MPVVEVVQGRAREGVARTAMWALGRSGDPGALLLDPRVRRDPYPRYDAIRARGPLVMSRLGWLSASHAVVEAVLRDPRFGHGEPRPPRGLVEHAIRPPGDPHLVDPVGPESMIGMDPPDHTRLRRLVSKAFTPRSIERLRPRLTEIAHGLLDGPAREGRMEVMGDFAGVLPVLAICEVLGVPTADRARFKALGERMAPALDLTLDYARHTRANDALAELEAYFTRLFAQRRREPGDDLLSQLIAVEDEGDRLSPRELMATVTLLLLAGFETTVNLIGNGTLAFLRDRDQWELVRDDPGRVPGAVEEVLRHDGPVQLTARTALEDADVPAGTGAVAGAPTVRRGQVVMLLLGGANRDPAVFADPGRFDVTRGNARQHLSFAAGPHHCLGAALARLEGEVAFAALAERFPRLAPAGAPRRRQTLILRGLEHLPVRAG